jgi:AcrR family transcriptional regulator
MRAFTRIERGHAATNTNLVAERAGVSVGSLYQYFPNKLALINALRSRHARDMTVSMEREFKRRPGETLRATLTRVIEASVQAHQVDADLHRALEQCEELGLPDDDDHDVMLMHALHALIHAVVLDRPTGISVKAATREMVRLADGYLTAPE